MWLGEDESFRGYISFEKSSTLLCSPEAAKAATESRREKSMSPEIAVKKGIKIAAAEAARLEPQQIARMLPETPPQGEVEGQTFCTSLQCPNCGKSGRCDIDPVPGKYFRCINCGSVFRT